MSKLRISESGPIPAEYYRADRASWRGYGIAVVLIYLATAITAALVLAWPLKARAEWQPNIAGGRLEVTAGQCKQDKIGNGIWYQDYYDHKLDMRAGCESVAVSWITGRNDKGWAFGWRLAYVDLGALRVHSTFAMRDDEQHLHPDGTNCDPVTFSGCIGTAHGEQRSRGISAGYLAEHELGPVTLGGEAGLFMYDGRFRVGIDGHGALSNSGRIYFDWRGFQVTPFAGATLQRGNLFVRARIYAKVRAAEHSCGGCSGFANGSARELHAGLSIKF